MPEMIVPPAGVLMFQENRYVRLDGTKFKGKKEAVESKTYRVRDDEGWRAPTREELAWILEHGESFVEAKRESAR